MHSRSLLLLIVLLATALTAGAQSRPNEHVVQSGDTLFRIASEHGISVAELRQLNNLNGDLIMVGQRLRLSSLVPLPPRPVVGADGQLIPQIPPQNNTRPVVDEPTPPPPGDITRTDIPSSGTPPPQPTVNPSAGDTQRVHVVQSGETLFAIALQYNTTVQALRDLNRIDGDFIEVGQRLVISGSRTTQTTNLVRRLPPFSIDNTTVPADMVHFVEPGETLYSVAARLDVSLDDLLAINSLTTSALEAGTILYMPRPVDLRILTERRQVPAVDTMGLALVYPGGMQGRRMAGGINYDPDMLIASHRTLPLGSVVLVTNPASQRSVFVQIMDRGPVSQSYLVELSRAAADALELDPNSARRIELRKLP